MFSDFCSVRSSQISQSQLIKLFLQCAAECQLTLFLRILTQSQSNVVHHSSHASQHVSQNASFLYIVVLCQLWLVKLNRFQYYLDCDCMFDLFYSIEVYICEVSLFSSQCTEVYSSEALLFSTLSEALPTAHIVVFIMLWSQRLFCYFYCVVCWSSVTMKHSEKYLKSTARLLFRILLT